MRFATTVAITVLATLVIGAVAYAGATGLRFNRIAAEPHPVPPQPSPSLPVAALPSPIPIPGPTGPFAVDAYMVDGSTGWMLVSDCPARTSDQCTYATARTDDAGATWTRPVQVGPSFSPSDGDAPRTIAFLNHDDGFVYGSDAAFVTHDAGATWQKAALPGFIGTVAISPPTVWETDYPCAKGTLCQYEIRSSVDGGRSWSYPHKLPLNFSPETVVAFAQGVAMSSAPTGEIVMTADGGRSWQSIKSPCAGNPFRGRVATFDGSELWELCFGYPNDAGVVNDRSLFVSTDGGKTWSARVANQTGSSVVSWLVSNSLHSAIASGDRATFITHDGGKSWAQVSPAFVNLSRIFWLTPTYGVALDTGRNLLETLDGGAHWDDIGALPDRLG